MKISTLALLVLLFSSCQEEASVDNRGNRIPRTNPYSGDGGGSFGTGGSGPQTNNTTDAPIDGGLSVLLLAGAAYGTRHLAKRKKKDQ